MSINWNNARTMSENLSKRLPQITTKFFAMGNEALTAKASWEEMHQFRLSAKKLRYTLELFRDVYGPSLDVYVSALRGLQTKLGEVNDAITAREILKDLPGSDNARRSLFRRAKARRKKLHAYWADEFAGQDKRWHDYFKFGLVE